MVNLIQNIFLSPLFILLVLSVIFMILTRWALFGIKEYAGYGLGWLVGLFFIIVYSALVGGDAPEPVVETATGLTFIEVILASILGIIFGALTIFFTRIGGGSRVKQSLKIAMLTTVGVIIMFMMFVSTYSVQRFIGIFSLAFAIVVTTLFVLFPQRNELEDRNANPDEPMQFGAQSAEPTNGSSRLNSIREMMRNRNDLPPQI